MGEKGMSPTHELRGDVEHWEEQPALFYARRFQVPGAEPRASGEILRVMVAPQGGESATSSADFASPTEAVAGQGSLSLADFIARAPLPVSHLPNVFVVAPYAWPLMTKPWRSLVAGGALNTLLWVEQFERAEHERPEHKGLVLTEEVLEFCSEHRLFGSLQNTVKLVRECFSSVVELAVEKECDPESEDEWLLVTAELHEQIEAVLRQYDTYTRRFIDLVPWPQRNKIRFNYDLA